MTINELDLITKLHIVSTDLADELYLIGEAMEGKGVSPVHAREVQDRLKAVENTLRKLGGNPTNPVPFNHD